MDLIRCVVTVVCLFVAVFVQGSVESCNVFCQQPTSGLTCDNVTGDCLNGCQPGYAGTKCNIQCCSKCKDCSLLQGSVTAIACNECVKDYYQSGGDCHPCSEMCAKNESSSLSVCRHTDGRCEFGCKVGYYGEMCMDQCSSTCHGNTCNVVDGSCSNGCTLPVLTGPKCMDSCSSGCVNRECNQDGSCPHGCTPHYWNTNCQKQCSTNCYRPIDIESRICNKSTGYCLHGCANNTYWDNNCTTECSSTCANHKCDYFSGDCVDGCVDEYEGPKCAERIKGDNDTKTIAIGVGVGVGVLVILVLVVVGVCCCKRKKR